MRPPLSAKLTLQEFRNNYWLKEELVEFSRQQELPTSGGKLELNARIEQFLSGESAALTSLKPSRNRSASTMPKTFTRDSVIGSGWHCSQELRAFFETELGPAFHFNAVMRDFIKNEIGKTLQQATDAYQAGRESGEVKEIGTQFEYNRHIREYFSAHPGATLQLAIQAWKDLKDRP